MRLHGKDTSVDTLGPELRLVGLRAVIQRLQRDHNEPTGSVDYKMEKVVGAALRFDGNEAEKLELLDTIFTVVDESYGFIHTFENTIATTAELKTAEFLNAAFEAPKENDRGRLFFIRHGGLRRSPLAKIDVDVLIEWCRSRNDDSVWAPVAGGISLWSKNGDQGRVAIMESAISLLEAAPEPETVLEVFAERVTPSSWSGSRANVMQPRADAIGRLCEHENMEIAAAAKSVSEKLVCSIEHQKAREQREDREYEQKFE